MPTLGNGNRQEGRGFCGVGRGRGVDTRILGCFGGWGWRFIFWEWLVRAKGWSCTPLFRKPHEGMGTRVAWVFVAPTERVCGMTARDKCEARGVAGTTRTVEGDIQARSRGGRGCRAGVQVVDVRWIDVACCWEWMGEVGWHRISGSGGRGGVWAFGGAAIDAALGDGDGSWDGE